MPRTAKPGTPASPPAGASQDSRQARLRRAQGRLDQRTGEAEESAPSVSSTVARRRRSRTPMCRISRRLAMRSSVHAWRPRSAAARGRASRRSRSRPARATAPAPRARRASRTTAGCRMRIWARNGLAPKVRAARPIMRGSVRRCERERAGAAARPAEPLQPGEGAVGVSAVGSGGRIVEDVGQEARGPSGSSASAWRFRSAAPGRGSRRGEQLEPALVTAEASAARSRPRERRGRSFGARDSYGPDPRASGGRRGVRRQHPPRLPCQMSKYRANSHGCGRRRMASTSFLRL